MELGVGNVELHIYVGHAPHPGAARVELARALVLAQGLARVPGDRAPRERRGVAHEARLLRVRPLALHEERVQRRARVEPDIEKDVLKTGL